MDYIAFGLLMFDAEEEVLHVLQLVINRCFLLSHKLIIYLFVISFLDTKKGANQFHSVLKVLDYLYTKNENQLTPMGIC